MKLKYFLISTFIIGLLSSLFVSLFIYSGFFPVGADVPHSRLSYKILEYTREQSVKRASKNINVPNLNDPAMLIGGAQDYDAMCVACHQKPSIKKSDLSIGLYPAPPNLVSHKNNMDPKRQFWIIKHGIKASGMPAWGPTHDDRRIWEMVSFLQKLPKINSKQYEVLIQGNNN